MSRIALSAFVWGVYLVGAGLGFLIFPNLVLPIFGFPTTSEVWIRVVGLLVAVLGGYYLFAAFNRVIPFIRVTVPGRLVFAFGIVFLVASRLADPSLLIFGALDAVGALWTWTVLTRQPADTAVAQQA